MYGDHQMCNFKLFHVTLEHLAFFERNRISENVNVVLFKSETAADERRRHVQFHPDVARRKSAEKHANDFCFLQLLLCWNELTGDKQQVALFLQFKGWFLWTHHDFTSWLWATECCRYKIISIDHQWSSLLRLRESTIRLLRVIRVYFSTSLQVLLILSCVNVCRCCVCWQTKREEIVASQCCGGWTAASCERVNQVFAGCFLVFMDELWCSFVQSFLVGCKVVLF